MAKKIDLPVDSEPEPWQTVKIARQANWPSTMEYIHRMVEGFIELRGDRVSADDKTLRGGLGLLSEKPVVVLGQERVRAEGNGHTFPEGFRKAQRLMRLAAKFSLPVVDSGGY